MALAVTGQEGHALAVEQADPDRAGRRAVAGFHLMGLDIVQGGELVDTGAADHGQGDGFHVCS